MIDTNKYEGHTEGPWEVNEGHDYIDIYAGSIRVELLEYFATVEHVANAQLIADAPLILEAYKRLQKENKILAKYMEIVQKYDDALLADGVTDPRWSELYD